MSNTVSDALENAKVPGAGEVNMMSGKGILALFFGLAGLFGMASVAGWSVSQAKSVSGAEDVDNPLSNVLGDF